MSQKYGHLANQEDALSCSVCGGESWSWTDLSGEAYCVKCGTPHQIKWGKDNRRGPNINEEFLAVIKEYYEKTKRGCGMGTFLIERDYPDQLRDKKDFIAWIKENHPNWIKTNESD